MDGHKPIPIHDLRKANALENKDQWLKWRKEGIGGSDSAAARGKGKFKSTLELFLKKVLFILLRMRNLIKIQYNNNINF